MALLRIYSAKWFLILASGVKTICAPVLVYDEQERGD
jgi:hypothetical protein